MGFAFIIAIGFIAAEVCAETRTLTTQVIVTVQQQPLELSSAPQRGYEAYSQGLPQFGPKRYVRFEPARETGIGSSRYTVLESL